MSVFGSGIRPWKRQTETKRAADSSVPGKGELVVSDTGKVYVPDGTTQAKNLSPLVSKSVADATYAPVLTDSTGASMAGQSTLGWASVLDYGAKRAAVITDAAVAAGSTTVTSPSGKFTPAMNGQKFYFHSAGPVLVTGSNGWRAHPLVGTFTYVSATSGTLSAAATTAVTAGKLVIGPDTSAQFQAALDSGNTRIHIPANSSFIVNELRLPDNTELTGSNRYTSRLYSTTPKANVIISNLTTEAAAHNFSIFGNGWGAQPANVFPGQGNAPNLANAGCGLVFAHCDKPSATEVLTFFCGGDGVTTDRNGIAGIYLTFGCTNASIGRNKTTYCRNGINEDGYFDGNSTDNQAYCAPTNNTYDNNQTLYNRFGIAIDSGSLSRGASITNHVASYNVLYGIDIHSSSYVTIVNPRATYNGNGFSAPGIQVYGTSSTVTCQHITIIGPMCFANGTHGIKVSDYVNDWKIIGGMCARNVRHGIYVNNQANNGFIVGTSTRRNGQGNDVAGEYDGVRITSSLRVHVLVNSFDDAADVGETALQNWGVRADGTSDYITVDDGSKFRGNVVGEVKLVGANSRRGPREAAAILAAAQGIMREPFRRGMCNTTASPGAGNVRGTALPLMGGETVRAVRFVATAAPSGLTLVKGALVDTSGNVLAVSANLSSTLTAAGEWILPLSASYTAPADMVVYPVLLQVGTTPATMLAGTTNMSGTAVASGAKESVNVASQTDLTAGTAVTLSATGTALWCATA